MFDFVKLMDKLKVFEKDGNCVLDVYCESQKWVNIGLWISGVTLITVVGIIGFGYINKKW